MSAALTSPPGNPLPEFRGRLTQGAALGPRTWFRTGGAADLLLIPEDAADLALAMRALEPGMAVTALGACSNVIVRDAGIAGAVVRLARGFSDIARDGDGIVAGAAALDMTVAEHAAEMGLAGLEFMAGIPGTIGGAVRMNAGAYGSDIAAVLDWAEIVTRDGTQARIAGADLDFGYRHSGLPPDAVVTRARLRATPADPAAVKARIADVRAAREAAQPVRARTGGSTFRNPEGHAAWKLIDEAGCRGLLHDGAQVSEKHCNFLINTGTATSTALEELGEIVRARVLAASGIDLHWEIRRIGRTHA